MKREKLKIGDLLRAFGLDPDKALRALQGLPAYFRDRTTLRKQSESDPGLFPRGKTWLCLCDRQVQNGEARGHYFHQDLLVARRIHRNRPGLHVDVGSRVDGFVAHVAAFRPIQVIDIRPLAGGIPNVTGMQADFMAPLPDHLVDSCDSLSCLHALEHFGLGRYGDPVHHRGHLVGLDNLYRALKQGGTLYLSVPIGPQRIEFNAHRVFSVDYLLTCFADRFRIEQFSYVDDRGDLHENAPMTAAGSQRNYGCVYGCGIFELIKL